MRLAAGADVFMQNFRPGVADRLGVGEQPVRAVSPKIVYVSISGFGEKGPYAQKPAYDPVIQGFSGLATVQAGSDEVRPRLLRTILPDKLTAITASQAITAALLARERTGEGQHVRLSMLEAILAFLWASDMAGQTFVGDEPARQEAASAMDLIYDTADGYMTVAALTDRQWAGLARVVGQPEWIEDERFKTPALRQKNIDARLEVTQAALMARPASEWLELLTAAGIPCGPVLTRNQVIRHPQVAALGLLARPTIPGPAVCARPGRRRVSRTPRWKFAVAPRRLASTARRSWLRLAIRPTRSRGFGWGTRDDRLLLLADAERLEGQDHDRGVRPRLPDGPVNIGKGDQFKPDFWRSAPTTGCRRSSITTPRMGRGDFRIRRDPDPPRRADRPLHGAEPPRPQGDPRVAVLASRQSRPDGRPAQPLRQLR